MPVLFTNNFDHEDFAEAQLIKDAEHLLHIADKQNYELSILITDDSAIREINATWRDKDKPTNVLSFPMDDEEDSHHPMLGDIIISIDTAKREAVDKKHSLQIYLTRLIVHGFTHLLGYDHEQSTEAYTEMTTIEQNFLRKLAENTQGL